MWHPAVRVRPQREECILKKITKRIGTVWGRLAGGLTVLLIVGLVYQAAATSANRPALPPGGSLVDVGGYRLFLQTMGTAGSNPTVVFDSGLGTASSTANWSLVAPELAKHTQVVTYDRAGYGFSDDTDAPRTSARLAEDLHTLLHTAGIPGPYLLVGHSLGGFTVRMFAHRYPAEVAGVVLVDAAQEDQYHEDSSMLPYQVARTVGLVRGLGTAGFLSDTDPVDGHLAPGDARLMKEFVYARLANATQRSEAATAWTAGNRNDLHTARATGFGDKPLVVLTSAQNMTNMPDWGPLQHAQLGLSTRSRQEIIDSGHGIHWEQPQAVINAVTGLLPR